MRLVVLQIDNRLPEDMHAVSFGSATKDASMRVQFTFRNQEIIRKKGWVHDLRFTGDDDKPPWWWKVFAMRDLFLADPDPASLLVLWMDTDAVLADCTGSCPIQLAVNDPTACMWISPDEVPWRSPFNAGAFLIRGTATGQRLLDDWCKLYDPRMWQEVATVQLTDMHAVVF